MTNPKKIPKFKSEAEEQNFWRKHDSCDYIDWSKAKRATFPLIQGVNSLKKQDHDKS